MSWDKYVDANGVLRNLLGITDANRLSEVEADFTRRRIRELEISTELVGRDQPLETVDIPKN